MKNIIKLSIVFLLCLPLLTACGTTKQESQKPVPPSSTSSNQQPAPAPVELKDIKATIDIDWDAKKGNLTKYIVTIKNNSNKMFSGKVTVTPTTARVMESFSVDVPQLVPGEGKTVISFAEIKSDTKFEYQVSGNFTEFNTKTALNYKTIKTMPGNGYMTFWIYSQDTSKDNLIAISKDMREKYSSLAIGFQIRFFDTETPKDMPENIAAYALTKNLKLSRLTIFKNNDEEININ